jgi:predicted nucleic acid-binding protein
MSEPAVVLDSEALSLLSGPASPGQRRLAVLVDRTRHRSGRVVVPAVVCAEVCRDASRTRAVESLLRRFPADVVGGIEILETDISVAKEVGALLGVAGLGSEHLADAHVVVAAVRCSGAIVATSDAGDIRRLADYQPAVRIVTFRC